MVRPETFLSLMEIVIHESEVLHGKFMHENSSTWVKFLFPPRYLMFPVLYSTHLAEATASDLMLKCEVRVCDAGHRQAALGGHTNSAGAAAGVRATSCTVGSCPVCAAPTGVLLAWLLLLLWRLLLLWWWWWRHQLLLGLLGMWGWGCGWLLLWLLWRRGAD
jgi:hypothetical protein